MHCLQLDTIVVWIVVYRLLMPIQSLALSINIYLYIHIYLHIYIIYMLLCNLLFEMIYFHIKHSYAIYKKVEDYTDLQP